MAASGQAKFTVPTPTDTQKYQSTAWQLNYAYLIQISYAKSLGKTIEDVATFDGNSFNTTWDKNAGFDGLVNGMLYNYMIFAPNGSVEIMEQANNKVVIRVTNIFTELKNQGSMYGVSYGEYLKFFDICVSKIAEYLGAVSSQKDTEEGLIVTMQKK